MSEQREEAQTETRMKLMITSFQRKVDDTVQRGQNVTVNYQPLPKQVGKIRLDGGVLLVGQVASGKTFLIRQLLRDWIEQNPMIRYYTGLSSVHWPADRLPGERIFPLESLSDQTCLHRGPVVVLDDCSSAKQLQEFWNLTDVPRILSVQWARDLTKEQWFSFETIIFTKIPTKNFVELRDGAIDLLDYVGYEEVVKHWIRMPFRTCLVLGHGLPFFVRVEEEPSTESRTEKEED